MAGWAKGLAGWPRGGNRRTNGQTYGWKISPFYRTSSPIGAAALPPPMKTKEKVEQGKGTADHLMPLGYFFGYAQQKFGWKGPILPKKHMKKPYFGPFSGSQFCCLYHLDSSLQASNESTKFWAKSRIMVF